MTKDLTAKDFAPLEKSIADLKEILEKKDAFVDKLIGKLDEQAAVICNIHEDLRNTTQTKKQLSKDNQSLRAKVNQLEDEIEDFLSHLQ